MMSNRGSISNEVVQIIKTESIEEGNNSETFTLVSSQSLCGKDFSDSGGADERSNCPYCPAKCAQRSLLIQHMQIHDVNNRHNRPLKCPSCPAWFSTKRSLNRHFVIHFVEKPSICNDCGKSFAHVSNFKAHTKNKPYNCHLCDASFDCKAGLGKHHNMNHGSTLKRPAIFSCDQCSATFNKASNLNRHLYLHTGEKPFRCDDCSICFAKHDQLQAHSGVHADRNYAFKCSICKCDFKSKTAMDYHISLTHQRARLHQSCLGINESNFQCFRCPRNYHSRSKLTRHYHKIHSCDPPKINSQSTSDNQLPSTAHQLSVYKCDECDYIVSKKRGDCKYSFTRHKMIHMRNLAYKCDLCSATYSRGTDLTRHRISGHLSMQNSHHTPNIFDDKLDSLSNLGPGTVTDRTESLKGTDASDDSSTYDNSTDYSDGDCDTPTIYTVVKGEPAEVDDGTFDIVGENKLNSPVVVLHDFMKRDV